MIAQVDRRHIKYQPPFHVESFKSGAVIGADSSGHNCVRFTDWPPGAVMCDSVEIMQKACDALNLQPISDFMEAEVI
jgi:hypothetical protein